jgi:hypothetical protein
MYLRAGPVDEHAAARQVDAEDAFAGGLEQQAPLALPQRIGVSGRFRCEDFCL